ncbi:TetR/AcrR family transcriptional regulator [Vibrio sp. JC009]|uniref:TetR/AcrR family transcriptional regulator n=1 Tax=Vibrio sp. JC009 TaxID=2912314 RepID=UPI0023B1AF69|nr:TetR/AcrR family transcriptional regulator [Vibrio sp. JC009]WED22682.1 TetR/AcrR family transcriptional regulator [Vibrio sp. JC009]
MSSEGTERKIIQSIAEHYLGDGMRKLTIQEVSEKAGISRQSFNRFYKHLKPYVLGQKPIETLIDNGSEYQTLLAKSQERIRQLSLEVEKLRTEYTDYTKEVELQYITTLMINDTTLHETNEVRTTLEKQALHNEKLINQVQNLERELTLEKVRSLSESNENGTSKVVESELIPITPNLKPVFANYLQNKDLDVYEDEKDTAIDRILKKINKLSAIGSPQVTLFIDRYMCSFQKFTESRQYISGDPAIVVQLPLFTRTELNIFKSKILSNARVGVVFPFCDSESVLKSQRVFQFRDVPDIEFTAADEMTPPLIKDGYDSVVMFRVRQGD